MTNLTLLRNSSAQILALELTDNFISEISLSISSMKWMTKSTSLWRNISSVWKLVIRKLMSYPSIFFLLKITKFSALLIMNPMNL